MTILALRVGILAIGMGSYINSRSKQLPDQGTIGPHPSSYPKPPEAMKYKSLIGNDFRTYMCTAFTMD